jgi:hypothetical protein
VPKQLDSEVFGLIGMGNREWVMGNGEWGMVRPAPFGFATLAGRYRQPPSGLTVRGLRAPSATGSRVGGMGNRKKRTSLSPITNYQLPITNYQLPITPSGFASRSWGKPPRPRWLTNYQLPITQLAKLALPHQEKLRFYPQVK